MASTITLINRCLACLFCTQLHLVTLGRLSQAAVVSVSSFYIGTACEVPNKGTNCRVLSKRRH